MMRTFLVLAVTGLVLYFVVANMCGKYVLQHERKFEENDYFSMNRSVIENRLLARTDGFERI